jgi:protein ImuB
VALAHSPRVEEGGPGIVYLDATGLHALFGDDEQIARRLAAAAAGRELDVRVAIAGSRISALCACRWGGGIAIVEPGGEAAYLAPAPVSLLPLAPEMDARLARWGIRTLGQLAALPPAPLFERLGGEGPRLQQLARGIDPRPLHPWEPPVVFEESADLDGAVDALGPLADLVARLAERISDKLVRRGLSAEHFEWSCAMGDRTRHEGRFVPAVPLNDRRVIASLLRMWLEARPPRGVVESVTLRARPVRVPPTQASLTDPPRSSARCIAETMVRLTALVGEEHIGVPELLDSHRPDAVRLAPFVQGTARGDGDATPRAALALRRLRPRLPVAVTLVAGRPVELRSKRLGGRIITSAGPWRASGEWWTDAPWLVDEWDVELGDGTLCRLAHDGSTWWLEGTYD